MRLVTRPKIPQYPNTPIPQYPNTPIPQYLNTSIPQYQKKIQTMFQSLISTAELKASLGSPNLVIVDCRFYLTDISKGRDEYRSGHIPGASYAHLDSDLSGIIIPGKTGRHPFPDIGTFAEKCGGWGIGKDTQVVAYDQGHGGIAARLWFLLKWAGHENAAVLNGGWAAWQTAGFDVSNERPTLSAKTFRPDPKPGKIASLEKVASISNDKDWLLCDSRSADRFRGENETIDPVAGHIPGAISVPFVENLDERGMFLEKAKLEERFSKLLKNQPLEKTVFYCGSGVTACHNLLALHHTGQHGALLYPGSWSEWITDEKRPIETGE